MPINDTSLQTAAPSVNLVLITARHDPLARDIIDASMRATITTPGARLSVAYGGADPAHGEWLMAQCVATNAQGGDVRLLQNPDILVRLHWAMESTQEWVLFLSDDDPVSVNYVGSLLRRAASAGPEVAIVAPTVYVGVTDTRTFTRRVEPMTGRVADRLAQFEARADLKGVLYYAFHRRENVKAWVAQVAKMSYPPSYCDQLLTMRSILQGELAVTEEPSMQLRDEVNWENLDACTRSDARSYPQPAMAAFHELLWTADMIRLFSLHPEFVLLQAGLKQWMVTMLTHQVRAFDRRGEVLDIAADGAIADMSRAVATVLQWLQVTPPGEAFAAGLCSVEALAAEVQRSFLERSAETSTRRLAGETSLV